VDDFGTIINPMIVEGQVHGGLVQGIGQALLENCVYDKESGQLLTGSFMDYTMPRADDFPSSRSTPSAPLAPTTPWAPRAAARPAPSARRRRSSTRCSMHCATVGVKDFDMPASPHRVWEAIQSAKA